MKFGTDIQGPQQMNPNKFGDPMTPLSAFSSLLVWSFVQIPESIPISFSCTCCLVLIAKANMLIKI